MNSDEYYCFSDDGVETTREDGWWPAGTDKPRARRGQRPCCLATTTHWATTTTGKYAQRQRRFSQQLNPQLGVWNGQSVALFIIRLSESSGSVFAVLKSLESWDWYLGFSREKFENRR